MNDSLLTLLMSIRHGLLVSSSLLLAASLLALLFRTRILAAVRESHSLEKRRTPRVTCDWPVDLYAPVRSGGMENKHFRPGGARLTNRSSVGLCMTSSLAFELGSVVEGWILSPEEGHFPIKGQVVWVKRYRSQKRFGIQFLPAVSQPRFAIA